MAKEFALDYIDVAARIAEFRAKHPEGSLCQIDLQFIDFAGGSWVVYTAAAYRTPDDIRPGNGTAWEPVPGRTGFTRDSEVQNAETSAWGRAIVAALAADTKRGVASADEIRNRQPDPVAEAKAAVKAAWEATREWSVEEMRTDYETRYAQRIDDADALELERYAVALKREAAA